MTDVVKRALDAAFAVGEAQADGVDSLALAGLVAQMNAVEAELRNALRATPKDEARPDAEREADLQTAYNDGYSDAKAGLFASGPRGDARKDEAAPTVTAHEDVERIVATFDAWDSDHTGTSFNRLRDAINGVRKVERPMWYCIQCEAESEWPDRMTMHSANTGHQPFYGTKTDRDHHRGVVGKGSTTPKSTPTGRRASSEETR